MLLDLKETHLPSGIRVVTSRMPSMGSVAMGVWVGVGGRFEAKNVSGISHFIEHLLFKGTKSRSPQQISQAIEGRGGYFNAFTQEESTCYYARIGARHTWNMADILTDMYRHPRFAADDIDRESGVIIEEIMMYRDQPHHVVQERLGELLWSNHPLGRPLIGSPQNIRHVLRKDIMAFKNRNYVSTNTVVALAGKVEHEACVRHVRELLRGVRRQRAPTYKAVTGKTAQGDVVVMEKGIEQSHLAMGIRLFGRHDARRYNLKLLSVILGENMSSRLFQVVREKHGLAYSIHSGAHLYDETGALIITGGLDRARTMKAIKLIVGELVRLKTTRVGARVLRRAKDYAVGQLQIGLESTISQMMWLGEHALGYGKLVQPAEVIEKIEKVTEDDILRVANQLLRRGRVSLALMTPEAKTNSADHIREEMARL